MRDPLIRIFLLELVLLYFLHSSSFGNAYPTGAGSCSVGGAAVGGSHLTGSLTSGAIDLASGLDVSINDQLLSPGTVFPIASTTTTATLSLISMNGFKGFSFILSGASNAVGLALTDTTNQKVNNMCGQDIASATHANADVKNQVDLTLQFTQANLAAATTDVPLDITVVVSNSGGISEYYYSQFTLQLMKQPATALALMEANSQFSTFVTHVKTVSTVETALSNTAAALTLFAPWNFYFNSVLTDERVIRILDDAQFSLHKQQLLEYQIHNLGALTETTLVSRASGATNFLQMINGELVTLDPLSTTSVQLLDRGSNAIFIQNADLQADNGLVHMTNGLLLPDSAALNLYDSLAANTGEYSTLVELLVLAGLDTDVQGIGPITMFAPNNAAFNRMDQTELAFLKQTENLALLQDVLQYHVAPGVLTSTTLSQTNPTRVVMLNQKATTVSISTNRQVTRTITSTSQNVATFVGIESLVNNGILHTISEVLIPATNVFTMEPSGIPSQLPSVSPSDVPSSLPSMAPSDLPSSLPSMQPSSLPSGLPSMMPSQLPSSRPSITGSAQPSRSPSGRPSSVPSLRPSIGPTSTPSSRPSSVPSLSAYPTNPGPTTKKPTPVPSAVPSRQPSSRPSLRPSSVPSSKPSAVPSSQPSSPPSKLPSSRPSSVPSALPSKMPSQAPSGVPSSRPSFRPSVSFYPTGSGPTTRKPTQHPSAQPSSRPSFRPSSNPSFRPSSNPSALPSVSPSLSARPTQSGPVPSDVPSTSPSGWPSSMPSSSPSAPPSISAAPSSSTQAPTTFTTKPSAAPTELPSSEPSGLPTMLPSNLPTDHPSTTPSWIPSQVPSTIPTTTPTLPLSRVLVESSFVLFNEAGLTADDLMSPDHGGGLNRSWAVFVRGVVEDVQDGRRRLRRRRLQDDSGVELQNRESQIYGARDMDCPETTTDGSAVPQDAVCQEAFGGYVLAVADDKDPLAVQYTYGNATVEAIESGELAETVETTSPNSPFVVAGGAPTAPTKGKGKMLGWYITIIALACFFCVLGSGFLAAKQYYDGLARKVQDEIEDDLVDAYVERCQPKPSPPETVVEDVPMDSARLLDSESVSEMADSVSDDSETTFESEVSSKSFESAMRSAEKDELRPDKATGSEDNDTRVVNFDEPFESEHESEVSSRDKNWDRDVGDPSEHEPANLVLEEKRIGEAPPVSGDQLGDSLSEDESVEARKLDPLIGRSSHSPTRDGHRKSMIDPPPSPFKSRGLDPSRLENQSSRLLGEENEEDPPVESPRTSLEASDIPLPFEQDPPLDPLDDPEDPPTESPRTSLETSAIPLPFGQDAPLDPFDDPPSEQVPEDNQGGNLRKSMGAEDQSETGEEGSVCESGDGERSDSIRNNEMQHRSTAKAEEDRADGMDKVKQPEDVTMKGNNGEMENGGDLGLIDSGAESTDEDSMDPEHHQAELSQFWQADEEEIVFGEVSWVDGDDESNSFAGDDGDRYSAQAIDDSCTSDVDARDAEVGVHEQYPHIMGALAKSGHEGSQKDMTLDEGILFDALTDPDFETNLDLVMGNQNGTVDDVDSEANNDSMSKESSNLHQSENASKIEQEQVDVESDSK